MPYCDGNGNGGGKDQGDQRVSDRTCRGIETLHPYHHGEYEFGSPKKPAIMEAMALNFADNTDAKMQTFTEILNHAKEMGWLGFNRLFESNLRATRME